MYHIQTQLRVCEKEFGDFVVWTNNDMHVERILLDGEMWGEITLSSETLSHRAILPELMGKFFSKKK